MSLKIRAICTCLMLLYGIIFSAQAGTVADNIPREIPTEALSGFQLDTITSTYIWFRHDVGVVDSNYMDNKASLAALRSAIAEISRDSLNSISSIIVEGTASPLGHEIYNLQLSYRRAQTVENFLRGLPGIGGGIDIQLAAKGEDWDAFTQDIRDNYQRRNRKEVLELLESDLTNREKKTRLRTMEPDSLTWRILIRDNMNSSRHAVTIVVVKKKRLLEELPVLPAITGCLETEARLIDTLPPSPVPDPVPFKPPRTALALKTNLLYDAVTAVNFGVEVPVNKHFSFLYEQHTPWWAGKGNRFCLQFLTFGGEARWWFAPKPRPQSYDMKIRDSMMGHFLGINAWGGGGDIQIGRNFGCYQFDFWSVGLTYGYSMPIGKHFNLEFSLSAGYANIPYQHYIPTNDWSYLIKDDNNAGRLHYFGPTKAEVSLVWPIVFRKGGRR